MSDDKFVMQELENKKKKLECLTQTNLFRNKKTAVKNVYLNLNKQLNTPNIMASPDVIQILKDAVLTNNDMLMFGGSAIDANNNFVRDINKDIKYGYTFDIINIMKKTISRLNMNGIYLDETTINNIKEYIKELSEKEKSLNDMLEKMVQVVKVSGNNKDKKTLNGSELENYVKEHKKLLERSSDIENKLYLVFEKLNECSKN